MSDICNKCGLPKDICSCEELSREQAHIIIRTEKRRYGKYVTIVEGLEGNVRDVSKQLKNKLACGGTAKDNFVELQGNHKTKAAELLVSLGFPQQSIEIK